METTGLPIVLAFCLVLPACANVDTILLTSERFPPKRSIDEVAVLEQKPARPYLELAELRIGDSSLSYGNLQHKILDRAAALGADAVVFAKPQTQTTHEVAYEPLYGPWGYNSPYYGSPWGYGAYGGPYGGWGPWGGYSGSVAVPYDETMRMLMGTAIRYTDMTQTSKFRRPAEGGVSQRSQDAASSGGAPDEGNDGRGRST